VPISEQRQNNELRRNGSNPVSDAKPATVAIVYEYRRRGILHQSELTVSHISPVGLQEKRLCVSGSGNPDPVIEDLPVSAMFLVILHIFSLGLGVGLILGGQISVIMITNHAMRQRWRICCKSNKTRRRLPFMDAVFISWRHCSGAVPFPYTRFPTQAAENIKLTGIYPSILPRWHRFCIPWVKIRVHDATPRGIHRNAIIALFE
jgi:hypothetical protein